MKVFGLLVVMFVSGVVTALVTIFVLMDLGARHHGNYQHYDFGLLNWIPFIVGFLAPALIAWLARSLWKRWGKNEIDC